MILFLPAAGHIIAGDFGGADAEGFIQTSVTDTDLKSSFVRFSQSVFNTPWSRNRESSMSVRLATVVSELAGRCRFCSCLLWDGVWEVQSARLAGMQCIGVLPHRQALTQRTWMYIIRGFSCARVSVVLPSPFV